MTERYEDAADSLAEMLCRSTADLCERSIVRERQMKVLFEYFTARAELHAQANDVPPPQPGDT